MSTSTTCTRCGTVNTAGSRFCANCGTSLLTGPTGPASTPGFQPPSQYTHSTSYTFAAADYEKRKMTDRTKTELLIIIGTILAPIPFISILGGILALIGAILVILGREVFGEKHSRNAVWSIGIYVVGIVLIFVFTIGFALSIVSVAFLTSNPAALSQSIISNFNNFLIGIVVSAAITGLANVLFTYELQKPIGRYLLWAGYATSLVTSIAVFALVAPQIASVVAQAVSGRTFNRIPIENLQAQTQTYQIIGLIPAAIYATAYYMAWSRINRGEIPQRLPLTPPR